MEIPNSPPSKTRAELRAQEETIAFRETFLVSMADRDKEVYRAFGRVIWLNGVTTHDDPQLPLKRQALKAVIADLEHLVDFVESSFSDSTEEWAEEKISVAALESSVHIRAMIQHLRKVLGLKSTPPSKK